MGLILLAARWVIAGIFLRSGIAKVADLADFRSAVANYGLLPPALVPAVAFWLPFAEVLAGILLAIGVLAGTISALLALLLMIFAVAIAINLARGREFNCGCAGTAPRSINWSHVVFNIVLSVFAVVIALSPPTTLVIWAGTPGPYSVATHRGDALPILLSVLLGFVMTTLLRRAVNASNLTAGLRKHASASPVAPVAGRH
jgi:uncharacterized membrane protein YphA (DoxX/SURF4 family)